MRIFTLVPDLWSKEYAAMFFNVSEYLVRAARSLKEAKGILADPDPKIGKRIAEYGEEAVRLFYEDDEYSRAMPGKKDFVSIGKKIHKQKRLFLSNLKELYVALKQKNSQTEIGFSKFCSVRPKWCVSVGASGFYTVCVCTHHQNAILLVSALTFTCTYTNLMKMVVCDVQRNECMVHRCSECPRTKPLRDFVTAELYRLEIDTSGMQPMAKYRLAVLITIKASTEKNTDILLMQFVI